MAAETNFSFRAVDNNKPQVDDNLYIISPNDTPLMALLDTESVGDVVHTNFAEDLPNPTAPGTGLDESSIGAAVAGTLPRINQITKRMARNFEVTLTAMHADQYALNGTQYAYKAQKAFLVLAKQFETDLLWSAYSAYSSADAARSFAGLMEWLMTTGEARSVGDSTVSVAGTSALPAAYFGQWYDCQLNNTVLTEEVWNTQLQAAYQNGVDISSTIALCGGPTKRRISKFNLQIQDGDSTSADHIATLTRTAQEMNMRSVSMNYYDSDFGRFGMVLHRQMNSNFDFQVGSGTTGTTTDDFIAGGDDTVVFIDPAFFCISVFRPFQTQDIAPTTDTRKGYVTADLGLTVKNPKAGFGISRCDDVY